ncbi:Small-conductance mechanosensitive channel [Pustulibacterium marinum]|uniref:Small-conductance mechanosensitive channel n=1 Tax=Pustulibacterium marinum TaxID=1224947 RepID=A0A1I7FPJ1_9FLAO|nr:mechanosensitive ion channel domain-containing protein [Pustulibacterium marinum]SFU38132.1 Small-conductance mechanosensitive channel [Pustulibacterium marinum]
MKSILISLFQDLDFQSLKNSYEWVPYLSGVGITFVILIVVYTIANKVINRVTKHSDSQLTKSLLSRLRTPILLLICVIALWAPISYTELPENVVNTAIKILTILMIAIFTWMAITAVQLIKYFVLKKYDIKQKDNLKARKIYTQFRIIERVLIFIILIISISLALMSFSSIRKLGLSLITSAGIGGLILGLAAQKVLGGILAGIQIAIAQPIRLDDVVIVEGEWGRIEEINLTFVVVNIWDERRLVLPTTYFIDNTFQNWTRTTSQILGTVFIYTDYNVPFDDFRKELTRLLKSTELWDGRVNVLQVTDAKEGSVEMRALMSAVDSPTAWDLRVYIREQLIKFLQTNYPESLPRSRVEIHGKVDDLKDLKNADGLK